MRRVFIAGGARTKFIGKHHPDFIWKGHPDFGKQSNPDIGWYLGEAAIDALVSAQAPAAVVDKAYVANFAGELFCSQGHLGALLAAADPDLAGKPIARLEGACASGGLAVATAMDAIRAGADVVLVAGAEVQTTHSARDGADFLARAAHYPRQREIDPFTFPCLFARRAKAIVEETDTTLVDCARVSVKAYQNANRNPFAHMRTVRLALERASAASDQNPAFLKNPEYRDFLRVSDCSQVSDGGAAILLCSEDGLKRIGRARADCSEILTCQVATASLAEDGDPLRLATTALAAKRAYTAAGLSAKEMQVAEVHDCFSITEILMYEALGLAPFGQGARLIREGHTALDGRIPTNTGGGLIGYGHPVGATGVKQLLELHLQFKRLCGDYQLKRAPSVGIAANMGGDDKTAVVSICRDVA